MVKCIDCKHCYHYKQSHTRYSGSRLRIAVGTYTTDEYRCDHPDWSDIVSAEGLYSCEEMRRNKGWFSKEGACGPAGKLHEYNTKKEKEDELEEE